VDIDRAKMDLPPRRRDWDDEWHDIVPGVCPECGCSLSVAKDDPAILWEPGPAWEENCRDRGCHCHTDPVIGARRA
jgi:hypothetical protein